MNALVAEKRAAKQILIRRLKEEEATVSVAIVHRATSGKIRGRRVIAVFCESGVLLSKRWRMDLELEELLGHHDVGLHTITVDDLDAIKIGGFDHWARGIEVPHPYDGMPTERSRFPSRHEEVDFDDGVIIIALGDESASSAGGVFPRSAQ